MDTLANARYEHKDIVRDIQFFFGMTLAEKGICTKLTTELYNGRNYFTVSTSLNNGTSLLVRNENGVNVTRKCDQAKGFSQGELMKIIREYV